VRELEFLTRFGTTAGIRDLSVNSGAMGSWGKVLLGELRRLKSLLC
jgi:hypothetical protein